MTLGLLTVLIMLGVAYAFFVQGALSAFAMAVNVFLAGLVAFTFWEPLADGLEPMLADTILAGLEDWICLTGLFCLTLLLLRVLTNAVLTAEPDLPAVVQQGGGVLFGVLTGYLAAGFLACVLQTLPWHENFFRFDARVDTDGSGSRLRRVIPPDRVWLALMRRASTVPFSQADSPGFDPNGSFELCWVDRAARSAASLT